MDDDMRDRIQRKAQEVSPSAKRQTLKQIVENTTVGKAAKTLKDRMRGPTEAEKRKEALIALKNVRLKLKPIFDDPESKRYRLLGMFGMGYKVVHHYHPETSTGGETSRHYMYSLGALTSLLIKLTPDNGLFVDYDPNKKQYVVDDADFVRIWGPIPRFGWCKEPFQRKRRSYNDSDMLVNYLKDEIALAINQHRRDWIPYRNKKILQAAGVVATFLWASGALGQEHDPANDISPFEPDRDVPTLSVDME